MATIRDYEIADEFDCAILSYVEMIKQSFIL